MRRRLLLVVVMTILATACSSGDGDGEADSGEPTASPASTLLANPGNPGTLVAPTTTTEAPEYALAIEPTVGFLDACIVDAGLLGPCHCAAERLQTSFSSGELVVFEDRLTGRNEFSPEVAAVLVDCREAPAPPAWERPTVDRYVAACTKGSERLEELCRCSARRAQDVVPEGRVDEYLATNDVTPSLVDLINTCI